VLFKRGDSSTIQNFCQGEVSRRPQNSSRIPIVIPFGKATGSLNVMKFNLFHKTVLNKVKHLSFVFW
jgi:hypothetical protein